MNSKETQKTVCQQPGVCTGPENDGPTCGACYYTHKLTAQVEELEERCRDLTYGRDDDPAKERFDAMVDRDRYRKCLEELAQTYSGSHWVGAKVRKALGLDRSP